MKFTVVTGADARFWPGVADLLRSIRQRPESKDVPICVLDVGFDQEHLDLMRPHVSAIAEPGWDIPFEEQTSVPGWYRALFARPFLRDYFPGYDFYIWIDADAWVQEPRTLDVYLRGAREHGMAISSELYAGFVKDWDETFVRSAKVARNSYLSAFGEEAAKRYGHIPTLNAGVFAIDAGAPHWEAWADAMREALVRFPKFQADQVALNYAIHERGLPVTILPMLSNWLCHMTLPMLDTQNWRLIEPEYPRQRLGIVHMTHKTKDGAHKLRTSDGDTVETSLRYSNFLRSKQRYQKGDPAQSIAVGPDTAETD